MGLEENLERLKSSLGHNLGHNLQIIEKNKKENILAILKRNTKTIIERVILDTPELAVSDVVKMPAVNKYIVQSCEKVFNNIVIPILAKYAQCLEEKRECVVEEILYGARMKYKLSIAGVNLTAAGIKREKYDVLERVRNIVDEERYQIYVRILRQYIP